MATPNYSYEKRQRELAKKRKAEEKRQRKLQGKDEPGNEDDSQAGPADSASSDVPPRPNET